MSQNQKFIKGTLVGAVIGAIGGLLLAPKRGQKTVADLKRQGRGLKSDTAAKVKASQKAINKIKREAQKEGGRLARRVKAILDEAAAEVAPKPRGRKPKKR